MILNNEHVNSISRSNPFALNRKAITAINLEVDAA